MQLLDFIPDETNTVEKDFRQLFIHQDSYQCFYVGNTFSISWCMNFLNTQTSKSLSLFSEVTSDLFVTQLWLLPKFCIVLFFFIWSRQLAWIASLQSDFLPSKSLTQPYMTSYITSCSIFLVMMPAKSVWKMSQKLILYKYVNSKGGHS